ncbi:hypothetical protein PsYK624_000250 [Phanerochaete sordida]|uniref:Uncharacterized protein n=1 Tax=Phanerochaete sordida TaxID=48140 RepID=A0A9P3L7S8_9APHY|nr:hypothetical protein PsYK624_000250 [Phanerochaete sordida]
MDIPRKLSAADDHSQTVLDRELPNLSPPRLDTPADPCEAPQQEDHRQTEQQWQAAEALMLKDALKDVQKLSKKLAETEEREKVLKAKSDDEVKEHQAKEGQLRKKLAEAEERGRVLEAKCEETAKTLRATEQELGASLASQEELKNRSQHAQDAYLAKIEELRSMTNDLDDFQQYFRRIDAVSESDVGRLVENLNNEIKQLSVSIARNKGQVPEAWEKGYEDKVAQLLGHDFVQCVPTHGRVSKTAWVGRTLQALLTRYVHDIVDSWGVPDIAGADAPSAAGDVLQSIRDKMLRSERPAIYGGWRMLTMRYLDRLREKRVPPTVSENQKNLVRPVSLYWADQT